MDTGAQMSIISTVCAARCNLLHLVDGAYTGVVNGMGQSRIVGKIHVTTLRLTSAVKPSLGTADFANGTGTAAKFN